MPGFDNIQHAIIIGVQIKIIGHTVQVAIYSSQSIINAIVIAIVAAGLIDVDSINNTIKIAIR